MSKKCYSLPTSPWDQIGPHVRPGLSQTYIGGPMVVRSNPIGAIFDAVRAFCFPAAMTEVGEGSFEAEDPTYSSPGLAAFDAAPADDAFFGFQPAQPSANGSCGTGTIWDASISACVPMADTPTVDPGGAEGAAAARRALETAISNRDCEGARVILDQARTYRGSAKNQKSASWLRWQPIAIRAKEWLERNTKLCGYTRV